MDNILNSDEYYWGRVRAYSTKEGYGFIRGDDSKDIFLSSYELGKLEKKVFLGSILKYKKTLYNGERVVATDIELIEPLPEGDIFLLPDGTELDLRTIIKYGRVSGRVLAEKLDISEEELEAHGYVMKDLAYVFVQTNLKEWCFFNNNAPIVADGQCDIVEYLRTLDSKYLYL